MRQKQNIIYAVTGLAAVLMVIMCISINNNKDNDIESLQALNEVIIEDSIVVESTEELSSTETEVADESVFVASVREDEMSANDIIQHEIEMLKSEDADTVGRYFGISEVFDPSIVADKMAALVITFIEDDDSTDNNVILHLCNLDYNKMYEDMGVIKQKLIDSGEYTDLESDVQMELAKGVVNGEYELHYTIHVNVINNQVEVTEQLKEALTGGWYSGVGVELEPVECPITE